MNTVEHSAERLAAEALEETLGTRLPALQKQFPDIAAPLIEQIAALDPTAAKKYTTWLLLRYRAEPENLPIRADDADPTLAQDSVEGAQKLSDALAKFDRLKARREWSTHRDINAFKSIKELIDTVTANEGLKIINHSGSFVLYRITTCGAATQVALGFGQTFSSRQTEWCTRDDIHTNNYLPEGPLYALFKDDRPYVQAHFGGAGHSPQVKNSRDIEIGEALGLEVGPLFTISEFDGYWQRLRLQFKPTQPSRWEINNTKIERQMEICHQRFLAERWNGWTETCRGCRGAGCTACAQTGQKTYTAFVNPKCQTCHGQRDVDDAGINCAACYAILEQRWERKKPLFLEVFMREFEERSKEFLPLIADYTEGTTVTGVQALYNGVYLTRHPEARNAEPA